MNDAALHGDALPRVLAAMGFDRYCGRVPRGAVRWWPPEYLRAPVPMTVAAWFPPRRQDVRADCIRRFCQRRRGELAPVNRAMRDADVHLLALGSRIVAVCSYEGEWRSADGAARGFNLVELGAWRWGLRFGQSAYRIARLCGLRSIPREAMP